MTSFMGIMDFVQPDAADDIFAEMGISRAAPVPIPAPIVMSKPSEPPKEPEPPRAAKPVIEVVEAPVGAQSPSKEPLQAPVAKPSPVKADTSKAAVSDLK